MLNSMLTIGRVIFQFFFAQIQQYVIFRIEELRKGFSQLCGGNGFEDPVVLLEIGKRLPIPNNAHQNVSPVRYGIVGQRFSFDYLEGTFELFQLLSRHLPDLQIGADRAPQRIYGRHVAVVGWSIAVP